MDDEPEAQLRRRDTIFENGAWDDAVRLNIVYMHDDCGEEQCDDNDDDHDDDDDDESAAAAAPQPTTTQVTARKKKKKRRNRKKIKNANLLSGEFVVVHKQHDVRLEGDFPDTLEKMIAARFGARWEFAPKHAGWVHRLDYATSGLILVALNSATAGRLGKLFIERKVLKSYTALLEGHVDFSADNPMFCVPQLDDLRREKIHPREVFADYVPTVQELKARRAKVKQRAVLREKIRQQRLADSLKYEQQRGQSQSQSQSQSRVQIDDDCADDDSEPEEVYHARLSADDPIENYRFISSFLGPDPRDARGFRQMVCPDGSTPGSKYALTGIRLLRYLTFRDGRKMTHVCFRLFTGRTHQLRLHSSQIGHPIAGDFTYNGEYRRTGRDTPYRMMLHCKEMRMLNMVFTSDDPFAG